MTTIQSHKIHPVKSAEMHN